MTYLRQFSAHFINDFFVIRLIEDGGACDEHIRPCRRNLTDGGPFQEEQLRFLARDMPFHREIVEALDNRAILDTHNRLQENIRMAQQVHRRPGFRGALLETVDEHLKVIDALQNHDVEAAVAALEAHFRASTHRTFAA